MKKYKYVVNSDKGPDETQIPCIAMDDSVIYQKELRFWHWIGLAIYTLIIFLFVFFMDKRLPSVVPSSDFTRFSEPRARQFIHNLTSLGPRTSGSDAMEKLTLDLMLDRLAPLETLFSQSNANHLELEVQRPSNCFTLDFLSPFSTCYDDITNILVRISAKENSTRPALLLNCHLDTVTNAPGATDDVIACAIYLDLLEILARRNKPLESDLIILFNGAEENFLQGSHGFVTKHPWLNDIKAFINLEGTGSGGREILFQTTKTDSWILETYLKYAPHPHCNIIAQELFQSGIIPSETDFRIFRDVGLLSGLDLAYYKNGWVYHTEFDKLDIISEGSIQRGGDNILALTDALIQSPNLKNSSVESTKWVFFDVIGMFAISYRAVVGTILNSVACFLVGIMVALHAFRWRYKFTTLIFAFLHHVLTLLAMGLVGGIIMGFVYIFGMTMCWYSTPILVFFLYIFPMLVAGFWIHSLFVLKERGERIKPNTGYRHLETELAHYDATLIFISLGLLFATIKGISSAYVLFIFVSFTLFREPILFLYLKLSKKEPTPLIIFLVQAVCLLIPLTFFGYCSNLFISFFVPVMGRFGNVLLPELFVMPLSLIIAFVFVLLVSNFVYLTRPNTLYFKITLGIYLFIFVLIVSTRIGNPYKWTDDGVPGLRRLIALHTKRTVYNFEEQIDSTAIGIFYQSQDFRGVDDLPKHKLFDGSPPNCTKFSDSYCQLPYYLPVHEMLPVKKSRWVETEDDPSINKPLKLELLDRRFVDDSKFGQQLNLSFSLKGGMDKVSLHLTPLRSYEVKELSFAPLDPFRSLDTYFVFVTYGHAAPKERQFWVLLERNNSKIAETNKSPSLEIVAVTHQLHGKYQNSSFLNQLTTEIVKNRPLNWKWAITVTIGISEVISHLF